MALSVPTRAGAQSPDLCFPAPGTIDFEGLAEGHQYFVEESFSSGGTGLLVLPFTFGTGEPYSGGFAQVDTSSSDPGAASAGGSGLELQVNNVLLDFGFGGTVDRITLRYGEYGGNVNLVLNDGFANVDDFAQLHGQTLGGVHVSIVPGPVSERGVMTLEGRIDSFAIGGQELWIDDVIPESFCADLEIGSVSTRLAERGTRIEFTVVVRNVGDATSAETDLIVIRPGWETGNANLGPLRAGRAATLTPTVAIPGGQQGQTVEFTIVADPTDIVPEIRSANNEETTNVLISTPDLALSVGTWTFTDDRLRIPVEVSNEGDARSGRTSVVVIAEGWPGASAELPRLRPGASEPLSLEMVVPDAVRGSPSQFTVSVDPEGRVRDPDPSDNVERFTVEIPRVGEETTDPAGAWPATLLGLIVAAAIISLVVWRLLRPHPPGPPAVVARLRPAAPEVDVIPQPDGSTRHTVRLVPRPDPGIQLLQGGGRR